MLIAAALLGTRRAAGRQYDPSITNQQPAAQPPSGSGGPGLTVLIQRCGEPVTLCLSTTPSMQV
jgi:hypothetical protein